MGAKTTHGMSRTPTYKSWVAMVARCHNQRDNSYARYGAKGIVVCDKWRDFAAFLADVGERPSVRHTIDRWPNKSGNYEPGNCRWATALEQANNTSKNRTCVYRGKTYTARELSAVCGVPFQLLRKRLFADGVPVEEAVRTSVRARNTPEMTRLVLEAVASGKTHRAIAAELGASVSLVSAIKTGRLRRV